MFTHIRLRFYAYMILFNITLVVSWFIAGL